MSAVQVSRYLRINLEDRFASIFNDALAGACEEFEIPELVYAINFEQAPPGEPQNFFRGNRSLDSIMQLQEPELPALAMWTGAGGNFGPGERQMPRTFSGLVVAGWRFFLAVRGLRSTGLVDLREATEAAMITTIDREFSGVSYRGDLSWNPPPEQTWLDRDEQLVGFVQEIEFQASFGVNV